MLPNRKDKAYTQHLLEVIQREAAQPFQFMEVCGTHTVAIAKSGIREVLPANLRLVSGPGCPVCVTDQGDIDAFLQLARLPGVTLTTFGDMMRVPGNGGNLQTAKAQGADVRVVYSTLDALAIAEANPDREVVFLGIGFETTIPTVAVSLELALEKGLKNYSIMSIHKVVPPALEALFLDPEIKLDGLLLPGHVCSVLGSEPFEFVAKKHNCPAVVAGFEPVDVLEAVYMLLKQHRDGRAETEIQYTRVVNREGNRIAQGYIDKFFMPTEAKWRGMGSIPDSGLVLRPEYAHLEARNRFHIPAVESRPIKGCSCGDIIKGIKSPLDCPLYATLCTPQEPVGPCMVSSEGACAAYYRYRGKGVQHCV